MNLMEQLRRDEGTVLHPYLDSRGFLTIGTGRNLDGNPLTQSELTAIGHDARSRAITQAQSDLLLANDISRARQGVRSAFPWGQLMGEAREGVLINMAFNMGVPGLGKFKLFLSALQRMDWLRASKEMEDSLWYRQVGIRAKRLQQQVLTGIWQ